MRGSGACSGGEAKSASDGRSSFAEINEHDDVVANDGDKLMARPLISFRARPEDAEELKALAARERKTVSQVTGQLVEDVLRANRPEGGRAA